MNRLSSSTRRRTPVALALVGLVSSLPAAFAQQAPQPAAPSSTASSPAPGTSVPTTLREVQVQGAQDRTGFGANPATISRLPADLRDAPQSVTVINQAVMQSQAATSLASALRNVPGLTIGGAEGGQIGTNINLNGFSARTDLYLDGARDRAQYYRDTFALESVEVLMGPSSMLFGRGSTGGIINQVTKKPSLTPAGEVSVSASTTGLVRSTVDVNRPLSDTSAFRIAAMGQQGDASTREQTKLKDFGLDASLKFGINTPTQVTLSALVQHNRDQPDYGVPPLNGHPAKVDRDQAYGFSDDRTISDIQAFGALVQHKITADTSIRNQTQYNDVTTDARETAPQSIGTLSSKNVFTPFSTGTTAVPAAAFSSLPLSTLWVRQQSHDRTIHDKSLFNLTELSTRFNTGSVKHSLLVGLELGHDTYENQAYYRNGTCNGVALNPAGGTSGYAACSPLLAPYQGNTPSTAPSLRGNLADASATTVAGYVNDTIELSPQWKLVAGVRQDHYRASISNSIPTATTLASESQTVDFTSVRAGAIWQPTPEQSYYVSYSTSFNPSLEQLVATTGATQPLPPEKNKAYELGGKWDLNDGNLSLTAAAFQITQTNARAQNNDGTYSATGTIRVNGARAGVAGRVTDKLQLFGAYTHLDATIVDGIAPGTLGKVPANTPKDAASLWATYAITPEWEVGGGTTYSAKRYANNTDLVEVGGYVRLDAMLAYHQPKYDIRLNLFNLANRHYYDALIPSDGGRAVPGSGRAATLTFTYRL
ncbi:MULTISPECIES: TonB-dependent receptor [unclassified Variovorax]|uniref:TonB-dependent receptor n=1 Tax=unclassified Variovorax TaxID=663243 RepID=UPI000D137829|nr:MULTISPECIES: TonB-dependent siderophore receptor [unclassified Variovorax]AVQ79716.1 TonB-dependent siderophore receptor [Variovorax sp. PMC12]QRY30954.1 TonB-dependent siderophore receptor [Variovorax sp. PDNC026]